MGLMNLPDNWRNVGRAMRWARQQEGVTAVVVRVAPGAGYHVWKRGETKVAVDYTKHSAGFSFEDRNSEFTQFNADAATAMRVLAALDLIPDHLANGEDERYGRCVKCGGIARWWHEPPFTARWVHIQPWAVTGPHAHRAVVAEPNTEHKDAS